MTIRTREARNGVHIVDFKGNLIVVEGSEQLRAAIAELVELGKIKLILNLRQLDHIDSAGIGTIVACYTLVNREGGQFKLLALNSKLGRLLSVVERFEDEEEAVDSF